MHSPPMRAIDDPSGLAYTDEDEAEIFADEFQQQFSPWNNIPPFTKLTK